MDKQLTVLIAGGGTGGHLYPAIAIGESMQIRYPNVRVHYMGSKFGIESSVLPVKSLPHTLLPIRGLQRGYSLQSFSRNVLLPWRLYHSMRIAKKTIKHLEPDIIVGTGGYASAIPLKIAVKRKIPIVLQEQNSYPGITTTYFAKEAKRICIAFEAAKDELCGNTILTGNPIRANILNGDRNKGGLSFDLNPNQKTIFLFGGSQGSAFLNKIMNDCVSMFGSEKIQILWQTGQNQYKQFRHLDSSLVKVRSFIHNMPEAYAISDLIISRAGALTLSEITACGKPSILVPFPHSAGDHQTKNAESVVKAQAAILIPEKEMTARKLFRSAIGILYDDNKLESMSNNARKIGIPDATNKIIDQILEVVKS
ncbi:undecaprenyldiphospho-muramoylpentapeptide beta-N-acetylglucosaminyltransferase [bacterium]|nr:undecaprenyldiphospho-muramoylpentapeptide beta-N-acetylglucosaminyltransferase [bacterium]